jgi:diguanylate cyclase (GGDEF)-like protein
VIKRAKHQLFDLSDLAIEFYRESPLCRAICLGLGLLCGMLVLDCFAGFPTGTRMAYVLPLWAATKRGGRTAGATLVLITTISLALIDSAKAGRTNSVLVNFALQTAVLYGLMHIFDSLESHLRNWTNLATKDSLTGLWNRFAIEEKAKKSIDRSTILGQTLTVAMIDCDRFKELNDQFGHAYGDEVLRLLSRCMRRALSNDAVIGRTGGDEFIAVLPNRDRREALSALDAALERFMSHTEIIGRSAGFSYGVAVLGEDGFDYERLVRLADEDMYRRKSGRSSISATLAS